MMASLLNYLVHQDFLLRILTQVYLDVLVALTLTFGINFNISQSGFVCSKLILETLEQGVKYVQS